MGGHSAGPSSPGTSGLRLAALSLQPSGGSANARRRLLRLEGDGQTRGRGRGGRRRSELDLGSAEGSGSLRDVGLGKLKGPRTFGSEGPRSSRRWEGCDHTKGTPTKHPRKRAVLGGRRSGSLCVAGGA